MLRFGDMAKRGPNSMWPLNMRPAPGFSGRRASDQRPVGWLACSQLVAYWRSALEILRGGCASGPEGGHARRREARALFSLIGPPPLPRFRLSCRLPMRGSVGDIADPGSRAEAGSGFDGTPRRLARQQASAQPARRAPDTFTSSLGGQPRLWRRSAGVPAAHAGGSGSGQKAEGGQ